MQQKRRHFGITLLEAMLALAVGSALVVMGMRQYMIYKHGTDVYDLQTQVDQLFYSAALYYQKECARHQKLDPKDFPLSNTKVLDINTDLIAKNYLADTFPRPNNFVDSSSGFQGYVVQLNKIEVKRYNTPCDIPTACRNDEQIGTNLLWRIQVSVKMKDTTPAALSSAKNLTAATCLSTGSGSPTSVAECDANTPGDYLVFERMPSFTTSENEGISPYWQSMHYVTQFKEEIDPEYSLTYLLSHSHSPEYNYYYCGS